MLYVQSASGLLPPEVISYRLCFVNIQVQIAEVTLVHQTLHLIYEGKTVK